MKDALSTFRNDVPHAGWKFSRNRNNPPASQQFTGNVRRRRVGQAGFSLIEVLCAIFILGVGIAGLVQGLTTALASHKESERQTIAAMLAASRIEMIQADGFVIEGEDDGEFDEHPDYRWRQTVTETDQEGLFDISVVVENKSDSQTIFELRTLLFDPPITLTDETGPAKGEDARRKREGRP